MSVFAVCPTATTGQGVDTGYGIEWIQLVSDWLFHIDFVSSESDLIALQFWEGGVVPWN